MPSRFARPAALCCVVVESDDVRELRVEGVTTVRVGGVVVALFAGVGVDASAGRFITHQAAELQRIHATGAYSISELAEVFNISRPTAHRTLQRKVEIDSKLPTGDLSGSDSFGSSGPTPTVPASVVQRGLLARDSNNEAWSATSLCASLTSFALLAALNRHQVDYVLAGGMAALVYWATLPTEDLDILASDMDDKMERLATALNELNAVCSGSSREHLSLYSSAVSGFPLRPSRATPVSGLGGSNGGR